MDPAYLSTIAALAGSAIGGLTSLTASWLTNHVQFGAQERAANRNRREDLYRSFIDEASKWYADAYEHDQARISNLVNLYALVSRMRILSSPGVIESADRVPMANAICERLIGTIRRECLDWLIPVSESHLRSLLKTWASHYNGSRPHMALGPGVPDPPPKTVVPLTRQSRHRIAEGLAAGAIGAKWTPS